MRMPSTSSGSLSHPSTSFDVMLSDARRLIIREHELAGNERVETFIARNGSIERLVRDRGGHVHRSIVTDQYEGMEDPEEAGRQLAAHLEQWLETGLAA